VGCATASTTRALTRKIADSIAAKEPAGGSLWSVDKDGPEDGKVVGTCDGGTRKIVYKRGAMADQPGMAPATSKQ
jgi:hypothetical protein